MSIQSYGFSSGHVWMWELNYIERPLDSKEIQPVHPKGNESWMFIVRTDAEGKTPILWLSDAKNSFIWEDSDAGKDWRHEKKGMTEDNIVGWHHQLKVHKFEQILGVGDGQAGLACCNSCCHKELDMTEWVNWTDWRYV